MIRQSTNERFFFAPAIAALSLCGGALTACESEAPLRYSADDDGRDARTPESAPEERCYGISKAGQNDGVSGARRKGADGPGTSSVDWQGNAWRYVPSGRCQQHGKAGGPELPGGRKGSLAPLDRDRPNAF